MSLPDVITSGQSSKNPLIKVNIVLVLMLHVYILGGQVHVLVL